MKEPKSIQRRKEYPKALDFNALKKEGIDIAQELSGDIWTDYNEHDPGVTILENVCYAMTELGYKSRFEIEDLFFSEQRNGTDNQASQNTLYQLEDIFPCSPLTTDDYRRLLIDRISNVKNAWVLPLSISRLGLNVRGLYKVLLQLESPEDEEETVRKAQSLLAAHRNVAEDFDEIKVLKPKKLQVAAIVNVQSDAVGEAVLSEIYYALAEQLSPHHSFLNLEEMMEKGMTINEIYTGPVPQNGFLDPDLLKSSEIHKINRVYRSKLIKTISEVKDVLSVNNFTIYIDGEAYNEEFIEIDQDTFPELDLEANMDRDQIQLVSDGILYDVNHEVLSYSLDSIALRSRKKHKRVLKPISAPGTSKRKLEDIQYYYSLQNTFPKVYGITEFGIQGKETTENKALAKQLKGYLIFFEQIIANFLMQLVRVRQLFSLEELERSYFFQNLTHVPEIQKLVGEWDEFEKKHEAIVDKYDKKASRRSRFLDHLMARLGEDFMTDAAKAIYRESSAYNKDQFLQRSIKSKAKLLENYIAISRERGLGRNYSGDQEENQHFSLRNKISYLFNLNHNGDQLSGIAEDKGLSISSSKSKAKKSAQDSHFVFESENEELLSEVMAYGMDRNQYAIKPISEKSKKYKIVYRSQVTNQEMTVYTGSSVEDCESSLEELIQRVKNYNQISEGFHVIEHILLRPTQEDFVFNLFGEKGILLISETLSGNPQDHKEPWLDTVLKAGALKKNYKVQKSGKNYNCTLYGPKDKLLAYNSDFVNKKSAENHISVCVKLIKEASAKKIDLQNSLGIQQVIKKGMQYTHDPYSFQLSIVAPKYAGSFHSKRSQKLFDLTLKSHMPAHLKINTIWLGLEEMRQFEEIYSSWLEVKTSPEKSSTQDDLAYVLYQAIDNGRKGNELLTSEMKDILKAHS